jgi:hypothetical protein
LQVFSQKTGQRRNGPSVDMDDFASLAIKEGVIALVGPLETLSRKVLGVDQSIIPSQMRIWLTRQTIPRIGRRSGEIFFVVAQRVAVR